MSSVSHLSPDCLLSVCRLPFVCLPPGCRLPLVCHSSASRLPLVCLSSASRPSGACVLLVCHLVSICFLTVVCPSLPDLGADADRMIMNKSVHKMHLSFACLSSVCLSSAFRLCLPPNCRLSLVCHSSAPRLSLVCLPSASLLSTTCLSLFCHLSSACFLTVVCPSPPDHGNYTDRMIPEDSVEKNRGGSQKCLTETRMAPKGKQRTHRWS